MPAFDFIARDEFGKVVQSTVDAVSRVEALTSLKQKRLTVVDLFAQEEAQSKAAAAPKARTPRGGRSKVKTGDLAVFCRQLSISVNAGMPLIDALTGIHADTEHAGMRRVLGVMLQDLETGHSFSDALEKHPRVFKRLFVSMMRSAEESGSMPETLSQLSRYLIRSEQLARKIKSLAAYPMFVMGFFLVVCAVMTIFVIPRFESMFDDFDATLPTLTTTVFAINGFLLDHLVFVLAGLGILVTTFVLFKRTAAGRRRLDALILKLPLFGKWVRQFAIVRSSRSLSIMLGGGVPIVSALEVAADVTGNEILKDSMERARDRVMDGNDIASSLALEAEFPKLVISMVSVGESSGRLPEVLSNVADMYEEEVENSIVVAMALFEPAVICFFGGIILFLILAIYLPIFTVSSHV